VELPGIEPAENSPKTLVDLRKGVGVSTRNNEASLGETPKGVDDINNASANTSLNGYGAGYGAGWGDGWNEALKAAGAVLTLVDTFSWTHEAILRLIESFRTGPSLTDADCREVDRWVSLGVAEGAR
jgi:hypothetical protein